MDKNDAGDLTIPVLAEELSAGVRKVATGRVRVTKTNQAHEEIIEQQLRREHVDVRRVQVNRPVDGPQQIRETGDTLIVPIVEEVLQIQKIWVLKEEIHIQRRTTLEKHEERVMLNSEAAAVQRLDAEGRSIGEIPPASLTPSVSTAFPEPAANAELEKPASPSRGRLEVQSILNRKDEAKPKTRRAHSILPLDSDPVE